MTGQGGNFDQRQLLCNDGDLLTSTPGVLNGMTVHATQHWFDGFCCMLLLITTPALCRRQQPAAARAPAGAGRQQTEDGRRRAAEEERARKQQEAEQKAQAQAEARYGQIGIRPSRSVG